MSEEAPTLKWGDIIRIHGVNLSKKDEESTKGLIVTKGFTDPNIYYQKYKDFSDVNLYRQSLFQIYPRISFDVHDQLEEAEKSIKEANKSRLQNQIQNLEKALEQRSGQEVQYGAQAIFKHVESQSFLRGVLKAADITGAEGAFKIDVTDSLSSKIIFKLTSHRSYEKEKDKIYYDDALQIYHPGADCFMNFAEGNDDAIIYLDTEVNLNDVPEDHEFQKNRKNRPEIKKPKDMRTFIINENKAKCYWKFIQHCNYEEYNSKLKIKSHDIVYFEHTKENGLVSSTLSKDQTTNELTYYLKESDGIYYDCFWELIPKQVNELGPEQCNSFWARNIMTGQLLQYEKFRVEVIKSEGDCNTTGFDNEGLINLVCSEAVEDSGPMKLDRGEEYPIVEETPQIVKEFEKNFSKIKFIAVPKMPKDIFKINKVDEKTLLNIQFALSSHEPLVKIIDILFRGLQNQKQEEFVLKNLVDKNIIKEDALLNVINIFKMLIGKIYHTDYENIKACGRLPDENIQKILVEAGIVELVIQLMALIYEPFLVTQAGTLKEKENDACFRIRIKLGEIFECCYRLLENTAAYNDKNRTYISRYVDLFLLHSNNINRSYIQECLVGILKNNPVSIQATINEDKIDEQIKSFFSEAKHQTPDNFLTTKYLKLFETFIICEDRVIRENQNIILNNFFRNTDNEFSFRFKLEVISGADEGEDKGDQITSKNKKKEVRIAFGKQEFTSIRKFFRDWTSKWNYFIAYVNLLADICSNRNTVAIENVSALLSLQNVTAILFDPQLDELNNEINEENKKNFQEKGELKFPIANIHEPFIRIAHHLYIDNEKFNPVKRIKKISRWYAHEGEQGPILEEINKTKRIFEGEKQEEEEKFLKAVLVFLKNYLQNSDQDTYKLSMLYTVLDVLKKTVTLGLWNKSEQFRQIIPLLMLKVIKIDQNFFFEASEEDQRKSKDDIIMNNKKKLSHNRPEITKAIQCKIKALQIFKEMNEYEIDIRLRYLMNFFKGLYETTEDFNAYDTIEGNKEKDKPKLTQEEQKIFDRNQKASEIYNQVEESKILGTDVKKVSEDQEIIFKQNVWYNKLKQMTPFTFQKKDFHDPIKNRYQFYGGFLKKIGDAKTKEEIESVMKEVDQQFTFLVMSLLQLPVYLHDKLLSYSIRILRTIFEQRSDLIENFKRILICGKGNLQEVYFTLKYMRSKFQTLNDQNILKYEGNEDPHFSYSLWKHFNFIQKVQQKKSGIIQDLWFLSKTLIDQISLKNIESLFSVDETAFIPNTVYSYIDERQKTNALFQAVNLAEGIYKPLISYIAIVGDNQFSDIHFKLLSSIYQYLSLLCFNNLEAKQLLMIEIPKILPHIGRRVGAEHLLHVISLNNKLLVSDEQMVKLIIEKCLDACIRIDLVAASENRLMRESKDINKPRNTGYEYEKSRIFYALRSILIFHEEGYKRNQELLMDRLQNNKYRGLIIKDRPIDYKFLKAIDFDLSPSEQLVAAHFELFSSLIQSGNYINIGKLQNIHSYPYCLECMKNTNRWQIRRALRCYVNRLYYVNKDKDFFLFEEFIRKQFDIINCELADLIDLHKSKLLTSEVKIKNSIRFKYGISEIMLFIIEIFISLHEILLKSQFMKILKRELSKEEKYADSNRPLHEKIVKLYKLLGCLYKLYPETKTIGPFLSAVSNLVKELLLTFQVKFIEKKSEPEAAEHEKQETEEIGGEVQKKSYVYDHSKSFFRNLNDMIRDYKAKEKLDNLRKEYQKKQNPGKSTETDIKLRCLEVIYSVPSQKLKPVYTKRAVRTPAYHNPHLQTTTSRTFKVLAKPEISQNQQNVRLNERLNTVKVMVDQSPVFKKFRDDEFYKLISILSGMDETSKKYYKNKWVEMNEEQKPIISLKESISTVFSMVIKNPSCLPDHQKIFIIKIARAFITEGLESKQEFKLSVDQWDSDYAPEDELGSLIERQNILMGCGCSQFIISILSEDYSKDFSKKLDLLNQILLLGIAYLFGGNTECQTSVLDNLVDDKSNLMLLSVRKIIKRLGDFLIEVRAIKEAEKKRKYAINIVDAYDYFSMKDYAIDKQFCIATQDKFEHQTEAAHEKAMCRIFRLLQLCCENNNEKFKKFLETQINADEEKKTNSVNFIEEACLLLRKFFKIMNNKVVNIPNNLLNFIAEITQLPCIKNQQSLMRSTFFQDISYLASFFDEDKNKKARKFNITLSEAEEGSPLASLMQIYEQGIDLALSNFQGNDQYLFSQFLDKCQPKYLWLVIKKNLADLLNQQWHAQFISSLQISEQIENPGPSNLNPNENEHNENQAVVENETDVRTRKILQKLDDAAIKRLIESENAHEDNFDGPIIMILKVMTIMRKIDDYKNWMKRESEENEDEQKKKEQEKAQKFRTDLIVVASEYYKHFDKFLENFESLLIQIEVSSDNGNQKNLQNLYFPKHPVFKYLSPETKDQIMMNVVRNTRRDKLVSLSKFFTSIKAEIERGYLLQKNQLNLGFYQKEMPITANFCKQVRDYARMTSFIIIGLLVLFIGVDHDGEGEDLSSMFMYPNIFIKILIQGLSYVQLILTLFYVYLWGKIRVQLSLNKYHSDSGEDQVGDEQEYEEAPVQVPKQGWMTIRNAISTVWDFIKSSFSIVFQFIQKSWLYLNFIEPIVALIHTEGQIKSLSIFVLASFLGTFYSIEYFTIHLFDIFTSISLLANVFKAVINNINTLAILSMLATAFVLVFNILSLSTYTPVIYGQEIPEESCQDILDCVLVVYTAGAIGDDMDQLVMGRFIFDIVFVVFMEMLFGNLISGVMLDSFGELKQQDSERDEDKNGFCYICGMAKEDVQKNKEIFKIQKDPKKPEQSEEAKTHVNRHLLWNYMFYIYCLQKKDATDYTGLEYYINKMFKKKDDNIECEEIDWFPDLGGGNDEEEVEAKFGELKQKFTKIQERIVENYKVVQESSAASKDLAEKLKKKQPAIEAAQE